MVGGAISGYWVTGKVVKPIIPNTTITMETTVERTGRSMNFFIIWVFSLKTVFRGLAILSEGAFGGVIVVLLRSFPTPFPTIFSPGSIPEATAIRLFSRVLTSIIWETANVSPWTLYT